jgi:hypothetical protein
MLLADILFLTIVVYLAYRFIFNFLLPIVRATHQVRKQFRDMQGSDGTPPGSGGSSGTATNGGGGKGTYKPPAEDYIDFEEVK